VPLLILKEKLVFLICSSLILEKEKNSSFLDLFIAEHEAPLPNSQKGNIYNAQNVKRIFFDKRNILIP
jgi:hypothetical protein